MIRRLFKEVGERVSVLRRLGRDGDRGSCLRHRRLALEPLESRKLLTVSTVYVSGATAANEGGAAEIVISRWQCDGDVTVYYEVLSGLSNEATPGSDYTALPGSVTIGDGASSAAIPISTIDDTTYEGTELVRIRLLPDPNYVPDEGCGCCGCGGGCCCCYCGCCGCSGEPNEPAYYVGSPSAGAITIRDDDAMEVSITPADAGRLTERESDTSAVFTISRSNGERYPPMTLRVQLGGTAEPSDYWVGDSCASACCYGWTPIEVDHDNDPSTPPQLFIEVDFVQNDTSETVYVAPVNDGKIENDETVTLSPTSGDDGGGCCGCGGYSEVRWQASATNNQGTVTIEDDDHWDIKVERTSAETIVERSLAAAQFTVTRVDDGTRRSGDLSYGILVNFDPTRGHATYGADFSLFDNEDCYLEYWEVTIPLGDTSAGIKLMPNNNCLWEPDEDAVLTVTGGTSVGLAGGLFTADPFNPDDLVYILDDDHWIVSLEEPFGGEPHTVIHEQGETATGLLLSRIHEVMTPPRTGDTAYPIDVAFAYSGHASANDYTMTECVAQPGGGAEPVTRPGGTTNFQIEQGHTQKDIDVKAVDDALIERLNEWLTISITNACHSGESYSISPSQNEVELVIRDNDKLELDAIRFFAVEDLRSDPSMQNLAGIEWQGGPHWHSERILGNNPGTDYVPLAYSSSAILTAGAWWEPADVDPTIVGDLYAFFEVDINGARYSAPIKLTQLPSGYWAMENAAQLSSTFAALWGQTARYRPEFLSKWYMYAGVDAAEVGGVNPQDGLLPGEQEAVRHTGDAESCLYVTYKTPEAQALYHTVVHTGCVAADGVTGTETVVFEEIWDEFEGRSINKINIENGAIVEGEVLSYYGKDVEDPSKEPKVKASLATVLCDTDSDGDLDTIEDHQQATRAREFSHPWFKTNLTGHISGLLIKYDGTCEAWQEFGMDVFLAQGIVVLGTTITPVQSDGFRVNDNLPGQGGGIPGENIFPYHQILWYGNKAFDPSYGIPYGTADVALDAFAGNVLDLGDTDFVNPFIPRLDAALIQQLDTLRFSWTDDQEVEHNEVIVTIAGYGLVYVPTDPNPTASDFDTPVPEE